MFFTFQLVECNLMQLNGVHTDDWSGLPAATSVCAYKISYAIRAPSVLSATPWFPVAVCVFAVSCFFFSFLFLRLFGVIGWCGLFPQVLIRNLAFHGSGCQKWVAYIPLHCYVWKSDRITSGGYGPTLP